MGTTKRILVVEDDRSCMTVIVASLAAEYEITTASNGVMGLEMARACAPDLILTDIMMPKMDGLSMLTELRAADSTAGIPFIFLTAKASGEDYERGLKLGACNYLTKPLTSMRLMEAVRGALSGA